MTINLATLIVSQRICQTTLHRAQKKNQNPKTDATDEEVGLIYFLFPQFLITKKTAETVFFLDAHCEQVGAGQECPLTPVGNIPQVNRIIGKESLLIGNQRGSIVLFWVYCCHLFAQIPGLSL